MGPGNFHANPTLQFQARNAALGAARILAGWDAELKIRLTAFVKKAEEESLANDRNLIKENAERLGVDS